MGYTHYWTRKPQLPAKAFAAAVLDIKKIMKHLSVPLGGRDGTGKPILTTDEIAFNGRSPEHYETFTVERAVVAENGEPMVFEFCKTNHMSYDICVQVALIVLKHHLGDRFTVSSDGDEAEWEDARKACVKWLGRGTGLQLE